MDGAWQPTRLLAALNDLVLLLLGALGARVAAGAAGEVERTCWDAALTPAGAAKRAILRAARWCNVPQLRWPQTHYGTWPLAQVRLDPLQAQHTSQVTVEIVARVLATRPCLV